MKGIGKRKNERKWMKERIKKNKKKEMWKENRTRKKKTERNDK